MVVTNIKHKYIKYLTASILLICLLIATLAENRSFIIGYTISLMAYWVFITHNGITKAWQILACIIGVVALIFLLALYVKSDSTAGRLLIYKVSYPMLSKHWLTGIGWGNFEKQYLYYQADYFKAGHYTAKELLLAGDTYFAFNDYYQLVIETGLLGGFILLVIIILLAILIKGSFQKNKNAFLYSLALSQIIAIACAALFTHVLYSLSWQIVTLISIAILFQYYLSQRRQQVIAISAALILFIMLVYNHYSFQISYPRSYAAFKDAVDLSSAGFHNKSIEELDRCFLDLQDCKEYLDYYGNVLIATNPQKAETILQRERAIWTSNILLMQIAKCEAALNKPDSAIKHFELAINMVPNRYEERFALFNYFLHNGMFRDANATGNAILHLPVKIPSARINYIIKKIEKKFPF